MDKQDLCYICYQKLKENNCDALNWGHYFWKNWWEDYLTEKLNEGYHWVFATCPYFKCPLTVTHSTWVNNLGSTNKNKYLKFHWKSYTDDTKSIKWCPNAGCTSCIENISYSFTDVKCVWGNIFCFKWNQDSHRPCSWDTTMLWNMKNKSESENITWMIANTKNCPKCQRPIEKNQGCNHMTCNMCKNEFCWLCLGSWSEHGSATGGYYKWNKYEDMKKNKAAISKLEEKREKSTEWT